MINQKQNDSDILTLVAPGGGVVSGRPVLIGGLAVVPITDAAAGVAFGAKRRGVYTLATDGATAFAAGEKVQWDLSGNTVLTDGGAVAGDFDIGHVVTAVAGTATSVDVALIGGDVTANA